MKKILVVLLVCSVSLLVYVSFSCFLNHETKKTEIAEGIPTTSEETFIAISAPVKEDLKISSNKFKVEVARTHKELEHGLMFRTGISDNSGMLFIFDREAERRFWMKNTYIPLDLIFIKADGAILNIHHNAQPHDLGKILSNGKAISVLEISGGLAKKLNINVGDIVIHPFFENTSKIQ